MKLSPTRKTDYGIRALLYLAQTLDRSVKAEEVGTEMDIPTSFLRQVLQDLQRVGMVSSRSGPNGGYLLSKDPEHISILEIVEVLEGSPYIKECALRGGPCRWEQVCALHWIWGSAQQALIERLEKATLLDLVQEDKAIKDGTRVAPVDSHRRINIPT